MVVAALGNGNDTVVVIDAVDDRARLAVSSVCGVTLCKPGRCEAPRLLLVHGVDQAHGIGPGHERGHDHGANTATSTITATVATLRLAVGVPLAPQIAGTRGELGPAGEP